MVVMFDCLNLCWLSVHVGLNFVVLLVLVFKFAFCRFVLAGFVVFGYRVCVWWF